jgi:CDP-diacylglycerol--serine O-phosphatidyltransferase
MNAEIPLFSLKVNPKNLSKYTLQITFIILSAILLLVLKYLAVPVIIVVYILLSVIKNKTASKEA